MKIYYLNDTRGRQLIKTRNYLTGTESEPFIHHTLEPSEGRYFDIFPPRGFVPFVKVWDNQIVLIDYVRRPENDR